MCLILPIQFTKKTNKTMQMYADLITVNNFFGHWIKDIDIRLYSDDTGISLTNNSIDVFNTLHNN